jgi:hypothetical protein
MSDASSPPARSRWVFRGQFLGEGERGRAAWMMGITQAGAMGGVRVMGITQVATVCRRFSEP